MSLTREEKKNIRVNIDDLMPVIAPVVLAGFMAVQFAKEIWRILSNDFAERKQWYFPDDIWKIIISYAFDYETCLKNKAHILENGWKINKRNLGNNHHLYFTCRKHNKYRCGFSPLYFLEKALKKVDYIPKPYLFKQIKDAWLLGEGAGFLDKDCCKELFEKYITSQRHGVPRCIHGYRGACRLVDKCRYYYPLSKNECCWMRYWGESRRQWMDYKFDSNLWEYAVGGNLYTYDKPVPPPAMWHGRWEGIIFNHNACSDWVEEEKFRGSIKVLNADGLKHFYDARIDAQNRRWHQRNAVAAKQKREWNHFWALNSGYCESGWDPSD